MTQPLNAKNKPFSWSPSAISDFITCPRSYAAKRFYLTVPYVESEAMRQGTIEHKHLEDRLRLNKPLPKGYERGEKYCRAFESAGGKVIAEQELAIDRSMNFVSWFSTQAWGRCKIDITSVYPIKVFCGDWKTGKIREDSLQLKINACFLSLKHKNVEEYVTRYIWLKFGQTTGKDFPAAEIPALWDEVLSWVKRMEESWRIEQFDPKPSGLCKNWCDVKSCEFCGKGRY